ncbi:MAG TPA: HPF/RaiA family ribosome-associated protein [Acetobacteraceae bacterium]|nr:HPF/RaiA family ribosome-associated protein [Acetobacteraceae bacterium]
MSFALHIAFRNMDASEAAEALVRQRVAELEQYAHRISACRVVLDCEHRQNQVGRLYRVHIDLTVPGGTVVVNRDPGRNHAHDDLQVAIRDAFETAERKIRAVKASHATRDRAAERTGAARSVG